MQHGVDVESTAKASADRDAVRAELARWGGGKNYTTWMNARQDVINFVNQLDAQMLQTVALHRRPGAVSHDHRVGDSLADLLVRRLRRARLR